MGYQVEIYSRGIMNSSNLLVDWNFVTELPDDSALRIQSGAELEHFSPATIIIHGISYIVLTGFEGTGRCFWCGGYLKGKRKRYCTGHMQLYYIHFLWTNAASWALERADHKCENCGKEREYIDWGWNGRRINLEVHHIVPLKGDRRDFSAFNLPWNLVVLCRECHLEIHRIMEAINTDPWVIAQESGQAVMFDGRILTRSI